MWLLTTPNLDFKHLCSYYSHNFNSFLKSVNGAGADNTCSMYEGGQLE